jgi:large subunit ribosomal protein L4
MELSIIKMGTSDTQPLEVSAEVFGCDFNPTLVHQAVIAYQAGGRQGTKAQKSRAEVRGGGAKPWRQKGMGRARAGTNSSPIWVGGGRTFAAKPRDFSQKVNRKMYRGAIRSILSRLQADGNLIVVDNFEVKTPKTKEMVSTLNNLGLSRNVLIVEKDIDENLYYAARNIPAVNVADVASINPVSLLKHKKVIMTIDAIKALEERFA